MKTLQRITSLIAALGLTVAAVLPAQQGATLGSEGEIFLARTGSYKSLFPQGGHPGTAPGNDVLALEIARPGKTTELLLVPGTSDVDIEMAPSLLFEESSNTLFLLWERRINRIYPVLMLAGFDGERWIDPVEIGDPMAMKSSPQIVVTRDTYTIGQEESEEEVRTRTIVHLLWGEETNDGSSQTLYAPIILENGAFSGVSDDRIYDLNHLDKSNALVAGAEMSANLASALRLQPGRDSDTVVAAFTSPSTRQVLSLEIDVLPAELSMLADGARAHIIDIGRRSSYPGNLKQIADEARAHIIDIGRRSFHAEIALSVATEIQEDILASGGKDSLQSVADNARAHIIDIGAKLSGRGLRSTMDNSETRLVEITGSSSYRPIQHLIQFRLASSRLAPGVPGNGEVKIFASRSGKDVLVSWLEADRVRYRESKDDDGWRPIQEIKFSPTVDLKRAYEMLEQQMSRK
jgi:hypothetical protein